MNKSIEQALIGDRVIIGEASDIFVENIRLRLENGIHSFELEKVNIEPVFCSSINKHTCLATVSDVPDMQYIVFDEHHIQLLRILNLLFYMYGYNEAKQPFISLVMDQIVKTPRKRLFQAASILLAEKSILEANLTRALHFLSQLDEYMISEDDYDGKEGDFDYNLFLLKSRREKIACSFVLNFYVYHELAHVKAIQKPQTFSAYSNYVSSVFEQYKQDYNGFNELFNISIEELTCDMYALDLLFDFVLKTGGDYNYEFMIDSFIVAITNLTIMDSVSALTNIEKQYDNSWLRINIVLDALSLYKNKTLDNTSFGESVHGCKEYCYIRYKNYLEEIYNAINTLQVKYANITEERIPFSKEWEEEKKAVISILASIK